MMQVKGLGGKKLSLLWKTAKIDTVPALLEACKKNMLSKLPGFGAKTRQTSLLQLMRSIAAAPVTVMQEVADQANELVLILQKLFKTELVSLCGDIRRKATTVSGIDILAAIDSKKLSKKNLATF